MEGVRERVSQLIVRKINVPADRVVETALLESDLSATSLDLVELVMSVEDEFLIDIYDDEASPLRTVGDLVSFVEAKVRFSEEQGANRSRQG